MCLLLARKFLLQTGSSDLEPNIGTCFPKENSYDWLSIVLLKLTGRLHEDLGRSQSVSWTESGFILRCYPLAKCSWTAVLDNPALTPIRDLYLNVNMIITGQPITWSIHVNEKLIISIIIMLSGLSNYGHPLHRTLQSHNIAS